MALPELTTWLLCLFAAVLLAARPLPASTRGWGLPVAFAAGLLLASWVALAVPALALLAGAFVLSSLLRPPPPPVLQAMAGLGAGLAAASLFPWAGYGAGSLLAWACALALPWASARLAGEPRFAPAVLRDEGGCAVVIAAPLIAALPAASEGWRSALVLAGTQGVADRAMAGLWFVVPVLALVAGVLRQMWVRR